MRYATRTSAGLGGRGRSWRPVPSSGASTPFRLPKFLAPLLSLLGSPSVLPLLAGGAKKLFSSRKQETSIKQIINAAGGSISKYNFGYFPLPVAYSKNATNTYLVNGANRTIAGVGRQVVKTLVTPFSQSDLAPIRALYSANPSARMCYKEAFSTIQLTNQDNGNVLITLYDVIAKRSGIADPAACWVSGAISAGGSQMETIVGAEPTSCSKFNDFWTVKKVYQFYLGAGESHCHVLKFNPNRQIPGEVQDSTGYIARFTHACMMVVNGAPYNDSTTKTQVSTGGSAVDSVVSIQYKYTFNDDATDTLSFGNNIPVFTVAENIMNENTGTAAPEVQA